MQASVKEDRQKWIGGSDIPIIMGISPFTTRFDLLLFKAGLQDNDFEGNEYTEYGNVMEDVIRDYINLDYEKDQFKETKYEYRESGVRCHLDGENKHQVLEIKTTSQIHEEIKDYKVYIVQLLFYMEKVGKTKGILAVYERDEDFKDKTPEQWVKDFDPKRIHTYDVDINDYQELLESINMAVIKFKEDLEKVKENPLITEEELLPIQIQDITHQLEVIENQIVAFKDLNEKEKELKQTLFEAMDKYGIKTWENPSKTMQITRVDSTPDKVEMVFNEDKLKEEQPVLYSTYCEEKIKKGKSGYVKITLRNKI
jgi:putative phage-type endonuclease